MTIYDIKLQFLAVNESTGPVTPVTKPYMVADYMKGAFDEFPEQEQVYVVLLDSRNNPKGRQRVTIGTQTMAPIHAREVFRAAILG
jgi:DNA repair protein RadC